MEIHNEHTASQQTIGGGTSPPNAKVRIIWWSILTYTLVNVIFINVRVPCSGIESTFFSLRFGVSSLHIQAVISITQFFCCWKTHES